MCVSTRRADVGIFGYNRSFVGLYGGGGQTSARNHQERRLAAE
jgi:hypothetical protein